MAIEKRYSPSFAKSISPLLYQAPSPQTYLKYIGLRGLNRRVTIYKKIIFWITSTDIPSPTAARTLTLVAKCLQKLANLVDFGAKVTSITQNQYQNKCLYIIALRVSKVTAATIQEKICFWLADSVLVIFLKIFYLLVSFLFIRNPAWLQSIRSCKKTGTKL